MKLILSIFCILLLACGEPEGVSIHDDYGVVWDLTASPMSLERITPDATEAWTTSLIQFWTAVRPEMLISRVVHAVEGITVVLIDHPYLELTNGSRVAGIAYPSSNLMAISTMSSTVSGYDLTRIELTYRHEMSHVILNKAAGIVDNSGGDIHHQIFSDVKLGQTLITQCTTKPNG